MDNLEQVKKAVEIEVKHRYININGRTKNYTAYSLNGTPLIDAFSEKSEEILLNGIDIRKYSYLDYLMIFSVVFQDFELLALKLGENVASGTQYNTGEVINSLHRAGFEEGLKKLDNGLDTYLYKNIDEKGVSVSGGEAQKIAIARALYKNSPFIILDEPTASLDPIAEAEIYSKFNEIVDDRTAIYISHRLSSCIFCDEVVVFDNGRIVQHDTHKNLLKDEKGKYFELWNAQAQYYK